jgi:hypothetical protein
MSGAIREEAKYAYLAIKSARFRISASIQRGDGTVIQFRGPDRLVWILFFGESRILANMTSYSISGPVTKISRGPRGVLFFVANVFREGF